MIAAVIPDKGQSIELRDIPKPTPGPNEVLIKLKTAALNRRDWWIQQGQYAALRYPAIVGSDGAGIVEAVGLEVDPSLVGREVIINPAMGWGPKQEAPAKSFAILGMPSQGTLAEFVAVPAIQLAPKPTFLSWEEAAALPLSGLTVYRALFTRAQVKAGEKVLITGAAGGSAQLGLQFAIAAGAEVWVTTSTQEKLTFCQAQGAKGGALYTEPDWEKALKEASGGFDVILDSAAGPDFNKLFEAAADGARISFFGGTAGPWPSMQPQRLFWKQLSLLGTTMGSQADFDAMLHFVQKHGVKPSISQVFSLKEVNQAFALMGGGDGTGKIVLQIA